jgi:hypothetical protein
VHATHVIARRTVQQHAEVLPPSLTASWRSLGFGFVSTGMMGYEEVRNNRRPTIYVFFLLSFCNET